ncbi:MAG: EcsC family protein [Desulfosporosinus sp.]|nr:EcsC family protein [Desulfosporosinus sp.]
MKSLEEYDEFIIDEIARHIVEPNPVQLLLELAGKPIAKVMEIASNSKFPIIKEVNTVIMSGVGKALETTIKAATNLCSEKEVIKEYNSRNIDISRIEEIKYLGLEQIDKVADSYDLSNAIFLGLEGALLGVATTLAEGIPFAQLLIPTLVMTDVSSSMVLLSRHVCQIATSYGYSSEKLINLPHILAAMVPINDTSDEGYFAAKVFAVDAIRAGGEYIAKQAAGTFTMDIPALVKLIGYITERLGLQITQKELGLLVPIAGAILNGGVNVAFQQTGHIIAKDYFRLLILENRYGSEEIQQLIYDKTHEKRKKA